MPMRKTTAKHNPRLTMKRQPKTMMTDSKRLRDAVTKRVKKILGRDIGLMFDKATGDVQTMDVMTGRPTRTHMPLASLASILDVVTPAEYRMLMGQKMPMSTPMAKMSTERVTRSHGSTPLPVGHPRVGKHERVSDKAVETETEMATEKTVVHPMV